MVLIMTSFEAIVAAALLGVLRNWRRNVAR
jgi:hypothetical protein